MALPFNLENFVNLIFSLGMFFNVILFIPQAITLYRTKNSQGLSLFTFAGFNVMQFFTAWHGYLVKDYLLMSGFLLSFITCGVVTFFIVVYRITPNSNK